MDEDTANRTTDHSIATPYEHIDGVGRVKNSKITLADHSLKQSS